MPPNEHLNTAGLEAVRNIRAGHLVALVSLDYPEIPANYLVVESHTTSSADALRDLADVIPNNINRVGAVYPDDFTPAQEAWAAFQAVHHTLTTAGRIMPPTELNQLASTLALQSPNPRFEELVYKPHETTLFVQTQDQLPFAHALFRVGNLTKTNSKHSDR